MTVFLAAAILLAPGARAETPFAESLDWLVVSRLEAGEYKLQAAEDSAPPGSKWLDRRYLLNRVRRLKGDPPKRAAVARSVFLKTERPQKGRRYLLFFNHGGRVDFAIDLESPGDTAPQERAFTVDGAELLEHRYILRAVKDRVERIEREGQPRIDRARYVNGRPASGYLKLEAPFDSDLHKRLFVGSDGGLIVPADPERLPKLLELAGDGEALVRAKAAWKLANYHTAKTETLLRELLKDPGTSVLTSAGENGPEERLVYPARQAAYEALKAMNVGVEKPDGYDKDYPTSVLE